MTFVSRLSVVTAYVAFAFVGAIVLGMFEVTRDRASGSDQRPGGVAPAGLFSCLQLRGSGAIRRDVMTGFEVMRVQLLPLQ